MRLPAKAEYCPICGKSINKKACPNHDMHDQIASLFEHQAVVYQRLIDEVTALKLRVPSDGI